MPVLALVISTITTLLAFAGCGFYVLTLWSARSFLRSSRGPLPDFHPPVSILKPVKGLDPEMYASFASHCRQEYKGDYEIIFCAGGPDDPAIQAIYQLQREFPEQSIRLVLSPATMGTNGKVNSLIQALPHARYDHILINDSDILVSRHYLSRIMGCFGRANPNRPVRRVGMVTALYRGKAHGTIGSRMEAQGIAADFAPSVLTAQLLEGGIRFGLGSTLAVSREALDAAGGLKPLADYVADDYQLGARIHGAGYEVVLSREVVETSVPAYRFGEFVAHQLRWMRTVRDARPFGFLGMILTYGLAWALLNVVATGGSLESLALLSITLAARVTMVLLIGVQLLGDRQVLRDVWLLPVRDLVSLCIWAWTYAGSTVIWRGEKFVLKDGRLSRDGSQA
jgi:ceramide glucosyltransferase